MERCLADLTTDNQNLQTAVTQLTTDNQNFQAAITQLTGDVAALQAAPANPPPQPPPPIPPRRKCPVSLPEKFDGCKRQFVAFRAQAELYMQLRVDDFPMDHDRVGFVLSLLSGSAAKWGSALLISNDPLLNNYQAFMDSMTVFFGDSLRTETATREIRRLTQGKDSVAMFITEFQLLSQDLRWNDAAYIAQFMEGLNADILDELARAPLPGTLAEVFSAALRIDARLEARREARANLVRRAPPALELVSTPTLPPPIVQAPNSEEVPMQLGAAQLRVPREEWNRR